MKVSPNSLIVKMIQNSFWFIEKNCVPKPTTSCGLFLAGVVSGLWHVAYTLFVGFFMTGVVFAVVYLLGGGDLFDYTKNLPLFMNGVIMLGMVVTMLALFIVLPCAIVVTVFEWLCNKGAFSKVLPALDNVLHFAVTNWLTRKLSALCKPIDYKDN